MYITMVKYLYQKVSIKTVSIRRPMFFSSLDVEIELIFKFNNYTVIKRPLFLSLFLHISGNLDYELTLCNYNINHNDVQSGVHIDTENVQCTERFLNECNYCHRTMYYICEMFYCQIFIFFI